jgi:hypothetical protein
MTPPSCCLRGRPFPAGDGLGPRLALSQTVPPLACTLIRPLNTGDIHHVHLGELGMQLADRFRGPLRYGFAGPAAGAGHQPAALSGARHGSWASAADTATGHKPTPRPSALTSALRVSSLPCLTDSLLLSRRYRAALEDSGHEQPGQDSWETSPHYSIT